ncbi:hypothetical protein [Prosthecobacter sp.]|uniref:hypothetical protein n=1 Tax=Prosthecobacter sp. TaxID=1965333 RepID=UPI0037841BC6
MRFLSAIARWITNRLSHPNSEGVITANAQFNHKIGPLQRGDVYEDPLIDFLEHHNNAGEVDGGGTQQEKTGEIDWCDVNLYLKPSAASLIPSIIQFLEQRGAPKGSKLTCHFPDDTEQELPFGLREGFGIYLDGVNLPDEVYRDCDINFVASELDRLLEGHGSVESHWQGPTETALYIYGDSLAIMKPLIAGLLSTYPLCKGARVVDLTPA